MAETARKTWIATPRHKQLSQLNAGNSDTVFSDLAGARCYTVTKPSGEEDDGANKSDPG